MWDWLWPQVICIYVFIHSIAHTLRFVTIWLAIIELFLSSSAFAKWICHSRHDSCLSARYHEVSNPGDSGLIFSNSPDIWQTPWHQRCRDAWQISERNDHYNIQFRGSETRDLLVRPLTAWWRKTLSYTNWYQTTTRQSNVRIDGILGCNGW